MILGKAAQTVYLKETALFQEILFFFSSKKDVYEGSNLIYNIKENLKEKNLKTLAVALPYPRKDFFEHYVRRFGISVHVENSANLFLFVSLLLFHDENFLFSILRLFHVKEFSSAMFEC